MDDVVLRAMTRWPDVPAVYGWLALDGRGRWRIKGELVHHRPACAFIGRNYAVDAAGRWYFQNGPQRVYVSLEYTPWVYRLRGDGSLETHTGREVERASAALVDDTGALLLVTEHGVGVVEDRDLERLSEAIAGERGEPLEPEQVAERLEQLCATGGAALSIRVCGGRLGIAGIERERVAPQFGFQRTPAAEA